MGDPGFDSKVPHGTEQHSAQFGFGIHAPKLRYLQRKIAAPEA